MILRIDFDSHRFKTWLSDLEKKQIPYATSRAMNDTAKLAVLALRKEAKNKLTLRRKGWFERKINFIASQKKQKTIQTIVYADSEWAEINESENPKRAAGAKKLTKPWKIRDTPEMIINKSKRVGTLMDRIKKEKKFKRSKSRKKPKPFLFKTKKGKHAIAIRRGNDRLPIDILYLFEREVKWRQKFKFTDVSEKTFNKIFRYRFRVRFDQAVRSPKK